MEDLGGASPVIEVFSCDRGPDAVYPAGSPIAFYMKTTQPLFAFLVDFSQDGADVLPLSEKKDGADQAMAANVEHVYPPKGTLKVSGRPGKEIVYLVASD